MRIDRTNAAEAALAWVIEGDAEDWGERWLVANRCLRYFDPKRGELRRLLARAWKHAKFDMGRKAKHRQTLPLEMDLTPSTLIEYPKAIQFDPLMELPDALWLLARGCSYDTIASALGMRVGTVKSVIHRQRAACAKIARSA